MKTVSIREALEKLIGRREATLALQAAGAQPEQFSAKVLRQEQAGWF